MRKKEKMESFEEKPAENKKLKVMLGFEMVFLAFLAVALIAKYTNFFDKISGKGISSVADLQSGTEVSAEQRDEMLYDADEAIGSLYVSLFPGDYTTDDGKNFFFNSDGSSFIGYVGKGHEDENGTYKLTTKDGINYVTIIAGGSEKTYSFDFTDGGTVELTDPDSGEKMELK